MHPRPSHSPAPATTTIHALSLHDALPTWDGSVAGVAEATAHGIINVTDNSTIDAGAQLNHGVVNLTAAKKLILKIGRAHVRTPDTSASSMTSSDGNQKLTLATTTIHGGII